MFICVHYRLNPTHKRHRDCSGDQQGENGFEKVAQAIEVPVLAGRSEQALDRQPAQDADLDAFPETRLGLGVEANLLVTLASCPFEAVSHKFDAIRVAIDIALSVHR
jgi:hypothetical protein